MSEIITTIEKKYGIVYIDCKRYYEFDMSVKLPILEDTIPYLFRYQTIEIRESAWNRMTIGILNALDKQKPKEEEELLSLTYSWSKQSIFSKEKRTNHTKFKNIYLNTNHTSTHSMMSIQTILQAYGINLSECYFLIRRHPSVEPLEVKEYFRNQSIDGLSFSLQARQMDEERINKTVSNYDIINKYLAKVSSGYNDFFLFDDYYYFKNYKDKVVDYIKKHTMLNDKKIKTVNRCLNYLDEYFANKSFYEWLKATSISDMFVSILKTEIEGLLTSLSSDFIVVNKLYSRMIMLHRLEMESLGLKDNVDYLFNLCKIIFRDTYYFNKPYISKDKLYKVTNEDLVYQYLYSLDQFSISDINAYIDKMHLKRIDNYLKLMIKCSDSFVQVDMDRMIAKSRLSLIESTQEMILKEIKFYINSFGEINSETYMGYTALPNIGIEWNKYSLIGIIRTYFNDTFSISYTSNAYTKLNYTVKMNSKGGFD